MQVKCWKCKPTLPICDENNVLEPFIIYDALTCIRVICGKSTGPSEPVTDRLVRIQASSRRRGRQVRLNQ